MPIPQELLTTQTSRHVVRFARHRISLAAIARAAKVERTYLSRIFAGTRQPTIPVARKLAGVLGMSIEQFMDAVEERRRLLKRRARTAQSVSESRVSL